jgi:hypothetical protein
MRRGKKVVQAILILFLTLSEYALLKLVYAGLLILAFGLCTPFPLLVARRESER